MVVVVIIVPRAAEHTSRTLSWRLLLVFLGSGYFFAGIVKIFYQALAVLISGRRTAGLPEFGKIEVPPEEERTRPAGGEDRTSREGARAAPRLLRPRLR